MPSPRGLRLGRHPRRFGNVYSYGQMKAVLRASGAELPVLLPRVDNAATLPADLGMMLNGPDPSDPNLPILGDCTSAAPAHIIQVLSTDAQGAMLTPTNADVEAFYGETGHYVLGDPSTDNGANMQDVMAHLNSVGYPLPDGSRHRPMTPPIEIDVRSITDVCEAIQEFGFVDIGMQVAEEFMEIGPPDLWDVDPRYQTIEGGHCVALTGYEWTADRSSVTFDVISWGTRQWRMTQAFWERFVDECYTWIDPLWIAKTGTTPLGLTAAQLEAICVIGRQFSSTTITVDHGAVEAARFGIARSGHWRTVEQEHLAAEPSCAVCGSTDALQVHHIFDFHEAIALGRSDLELDQRNLITLCEGPDQHHVDVGHLKLFQSFNWDVRADAARMRGWTREQIQADPQWRAAVANRPPDLAEWGAAYRDSWRARLDAEMPPDSAVLSRFGVTVGSR